MLNGEKLDGTKTLADYDIQESNFLDFVINATEDSLVQQLSELLQARDLTSDELGLLYCYKHGVSINQALKTVGYTEKFPDFIKKQKQLLLENGRVSFVRSDTKMKPFCASDEIKRILQENGGRMDIQSLCSKFTQKFNVSIQSVVNMKPGEFLEKEKDLFAVAGRGQVSLRSAEQQKPAKETQPQPRAQRQQREEVKVVQPKVPVHNDPSDAQVS